MAVIFYQDEFLSLVTVGTLLGFGVNQPSLLKALQGRTDRLVAIFATGYTQLGY